MNSTSKEFDILFHKYIAKYKSILGSETVVDIIKEIGKDGAHYEFIDDKVELKDHKIIFELIHGSELSEEDKLTSIAAYYSITLGSIPEQSILDLLSKVLGKEFAEIAAEKKREYLKKK